MAIDGTWNIRIESDDIDPEIVPRQAKVTIKTKGSELSGSMQGPYPMGDDVVISHGSIDGDRVSWSASMRGEKLRPQLLEFTGKLGDKEMAGEVEVGIFGTASFVATRA